MPIRGRSSDVPILERTQFQMTIDERIEKLTERHEALAQTVELFVRSTNDNINRLVDNTNKLVAVTNQDAENIRRLAHVAEIHEQRIERLEKGRE